MPALAGCSRPGQAYLSFKIGAQRPEHRLVRVEGGSGNARFEVLYDGDGQRLITKDSRGTIISLERLYETNVTTGTSTTFIYAGSRLIATKVGSTVSTLHPDHLGGVALTLQATTVVRPRPDELARGHVESARALRIGLY